MLWRFSFASTSQLDGLLSRETPPSLEELMDEQDILDECKAQNNKLVTYLSREDSVKSLLQWVIAGLDELNQQAADADSEILSHVMSSPEDFPSYHFQHLPVPGLGPGSPPLEPAKMVDELDFLGKDDVHPGSPQHSPASIGLGEGLDRGMHNGQEDATQSRYPRIATEILTSELWTITETIMGHKETLLRQFWDAVLPPVEPATPSTESTFSRHELNERDRARDELWSENDEERDRKREVIRGMWVRVNSALLAKRASEMIRFIQSLPNIVDRMIAKIASPAVQDMIIRIVSSDEAGVNGVNSWLADEGLITSLIDLLSPHNSTTIISIASEVLRSIITLCAPLPFSPHGGNAMEQQNGQNGSKARDNRLIRELVSAQSINTLVGFMLDPLELTDKDWTNDTSDATDTTAEDAFIVHPLPSIASASTSFNHICSILTEVIRRNNSDFAEPHLFHAFRVRLMAIRQQRAESETPVDDEEERKRMEEAMVEMSQQLGIVHLGNLLTTISERFEALHNILLHPRSEKRAASPGNPNPLTLERFRVVELYAELLHSSNMSMFNRRPGVGPVYTPEGVLSGGLDGLEALGDAIESDRVGDEDDELNPEEHVTQARELPVSSGSTDASYGGSDDVASEDDKMLEDVEDEKTPSPPSRHAPLPTVESEVPSPSTEVEERLREVMERPHPSLAARLTAESRQDTLQSSDASFAGSEAGASHVAVAATSTAPSVVSETPLERDQAAFPPTADAPLPVGDRLKQKYIEQRVLPTVVDLFFHYPQNDFLHHVVYDLLQQVLNGRLGPGFNRELSIELIREAKLIERILDAQRLNDKIVSERKAPRLAYMGHLILLAEDIVKFLSRCPPELLAVIQDSYNSSEWDAFVDGTLTETKARDTQPLAGGKPMVQPAPISAVVSKVEDDSSDEDEETDHAKIGEPLTRTVAQDGFAPRRYETFDDVDGGEEDHGSYWSAGPSRRHVDSSDEEDDDADWLQPRHDDDDFAPFQVARPADDSDSDDDDGWGNFASGPASGGAVSNGDAEDPFGDSFSAFDSAPGPSSGASGAARRTPSHFERQDPLTPLDWATQFQKEFDEAEPWTSPGDRDETGTMGESASASSGWSLEGDEEIEVAGEILEAEGDLSSSDEDEDGRGMTPRASQAKLEADLVEATEDLQISPDARPQDPSSPPSVASHTTNGPKAIDISSRPSPQRFGSSSSSSSLTAHAMSPPDPHLIQATSVERPLGPGVSPDTHLTQGGMLQKEINGETITVPGDEIILGVEDAQSPLSNMTPLPPPPHTHEAGNR